jgi:Tol biopolymer transport system component
MTGIRLSPSPSRFAVHSSAALLAVTIAVAPIVIAAPGRATFAGQNGGFVFTWTHSMSGVETDKVMTTGPRAVTLHDVSHGAYGAHHDMPSWSPSGRRIVYARATEAGHYRTVTVRPDGTDLRTVYDGRSVTPSWSPHEHRIAFGKGHRILVVSASGKRLHTLLRLGDRGAAYDLDWSTRGQLVFRAGGRLYTVEHDGTELHRIANRATLARDPEWSPDGERLVFVRAGVICTMSADGSDMTSLDVTGWSPTWSPDNRLIAYVNADDGAIHTVSPDGTGDVVLGRPVTRGIISSLDWRPREAR